MADGTTAPSTRGSADVVVVGGGVIGLSCAWTLAEGGRNVTVFDPEPARGASWVAAGMLAPVSEVEHGGQPVVPLMLAAAARWPTFAERLESRTGRPVGYRPCGTVVVGADRSDRAVIDELVELQRSLGLPVERLAPSRCRALVPALAPGVAGGAALPADHQVDNRLLLEALEAACATAGVVFRRARVAGVTTGPDRHARCDEAPGEGTDGSRGAEVAAAHGVELADGERVSAGAVLVTAGVGSGALCGVAPGVLPPLRPVKGHVVRLGDDGQSPLLTRTVRGIVHGRSCYVVPRQHGEVVVGATVEEAGYDGRVRAGAVHQLLHDARALVPGLDEMEVTECLAGLRPATPDNAPYLGWTVVRGLAVATGHYRNGILLAPLTAEAMTATLDGRPVPEEARPFDPCAAERRPR